MSDAPRRPRSALAERHNLDPFALFCAYYLGITADDTYAFQNVHHVAKRFGVPAGVLKQCLQELEIDPDRLLHSDFDLSAAQVDVMYVPEGVSRTALAREHWDALLARRDKSRDWSRELATDARENEKVFGPTRAASSAAPARRGPPPVDRRRR